MKDAYEKQTQCNIIAYAIFAYHCFGNLLTLIHSAWFYIAYVFSMQSTPGVKQMQLGMQLAWILLPSLSHEPLVVHIGIFHFSLS